MLLFILSCRVELTAYYRNRTLSNSQATFHSFSERYVTCHIAGHPSTTHRNIFPTNMTCMNQSDMSQIIQMNDSSFGMVQRFPERELCELKFTPIACFVMIQHFFLISSLIANGIYEFFSWMEDTIFLHSSLKSTVISVKTYCVQMINKMMMVAGRFGIPPYHTFRINVDSRQKKQRFIVTISIVRMQQFVHI